MGGETIDLNWLEFAITAVVIFIATMVHGITGFGTGQISMGLLPFFRVAASASIIVSVVVLFTNLRVFWSVKENFDLKEWLIPVIGLAVGLPVGVWAFGELEEGPLRLLIGIVVIIATIMIVLTRESDALANWIKKTGWRPGSISGIVAGFFSGILGGAVSIPGPPMIIYGTFLLETGFWERGKMKAIFTSFFALVMLYRLVLLGIAGALNSIIITEALLLLPVMLLGTWVGIKLYDKMPRKYFEWAVIVLLFIIGLLLVLGEVAPWS